MNCSKPYRRIAFFSMVLLLITLAAFGRYIRPLRFLENNPDSLASVKYINQKISYRSYYPFIRYEKNFIEWTQRSAVDSFFIRFSQSGHRKLKILHFGDSHIQADIPSGHIRDRLQEMLGYGGRGLVFPFKAAGTHAAYDYKTYASGRWDYTRSVQQIAKFDMGMIGATIYTSDTAAGFRLVFREGFIRDDYTVIKIYCRQDSLSFDLKLRTHQQEVPIYIDCNNPNSSRPYILVKLSKASDTLDFVVNKTEPEQNFFECYGLMIESDQDRGVLYSSTGINGAGYKSVLRQRLFERHLADYKPDLVIVDLGANDFFAGAYHAAEMENNLVKIVDMIQRAAPGTTILISNAQDIYYRRKRDVVACRDFMEMTRRVAAYRNCAFYNYYDISGGQASMNKWLKRGLARNDKVHLSAPGYYVRGELYLNALLNSYALWLSQKPDTLLAARHIIDTSRLRQYFPEEVSFGKENAAPEVQTVYREPDNETDGADRIYYKIKPGDNLGSIAEKYQVSVREIQYWNGLSGTKIIAGETLIIYKKGYSAPVQPKTTETKPVDNNTKSSGVVPNNNRSSQRRAVYKVVSGDTLWSIARRYNTTVEKIKSANNLKSDKLSIGQTLLIP